MDEPEGKGEPAVADADAVGAAIAAEDVAADRRADVAVAQMQRWYKRRRNIVIAVLVVPIVVGFFYWFPPWAIKRAHKQAIDCTNHIYQSGEGDATDCRQGGLLFIPKLIPWTRKKALAEQANIEAEVINDGINFATKRDLDRAAGARWVKAAFALVKESPKADFIHSTSFMVRSAGAEPALSEHAAELTSSNDLGDALKAAVHAGDRAALLRVAALSPTDESYSYERQRGAALCAFGDRGAGAKALEKSLELFAGYGGGYGYIDGQTALVVCQPDSAITADDVYQPRLAFARLIGGGPPERPSRKMYYDSESVLAGVVRLDQAGAESLDAYLKVIAPSYGSTPSVTFKILSPWSILDGHPDFAVAPGWDDAAAARLIKLADSYVPPKPKKKRRGEEDLVDNAAYMADIDDAAYADPPPRLRLAATVLALEAAVEWARRGDSTHARASVDVAIACANHADTARIEPFAQLLLPAVLQLVGRDAEAMATVDAVLARMPADRPDGRNLAAIQRALLLLHQGKPADAWTALDPVLAQNGDPRLYWNAAWLRAAAGLMLGKPLDISLPPVAEDPEYVSDRPDLNLAYWYTAATDPVLRKSRRWHHDGLDPGVFDNAGVLPALLYVVGKAADKGDVELWLDVVTTQEITPWDAMASARVEAARWRGDTAAAAAWDQRLAAMRALATDDRTNYLVRTIIEN